jgi:hypothetical protein
MTTPDDPELAAMAQVLKVMEDLKDTAARQRVFDWVRVRLMLEGSAPGKTNSNSDVRQTPASDVAPAVREGTISTVAVKIGASSCRTLLVAAAGYLTLYKGNEKFSREELVACAKEARTWKSDYTVQTSVNINRMCDAEELIEKSKDVYALSQKKLIELEEKLGD